MSSTHQSPNPHAPRPPASASGQRGSYSRGPYKIVPEAIEHPNGRFRFVATADWDEGAGQGEILAKLTDSPNIEANAHLFAASPDLLLGIFRATGALMGVISAMEIKEGSSIHELVADLQALAARATGGAA